MKRLIALALVLVMAVSLAGCCCCLPIGECENCGEFGILEEKEMKYTGETFMLCDECCDTLYRILK